MARKRTFGAEKKFFAVGTPVDPSLHYYVTPCTEELFDDLQCGKFCLLTGPMQSGKTTTVRFVESSLLERTVYLPVSLSRGLPNAKQEWSAAEMWLHLCKFLHLACPNLFPRVETGRAYDSEDFVEAFNATNLKVPVVLIVDEADTLFKLTRECLDEFLHSLRFLKSARKSSTARSRELLQPSYNLWSLLLVGTDRVNNLIHEATVQPAFPTDHSLTTVRFDEEDIRSLLTKVNEDINFEVQVDEIAESIFQLTAGHKGLSCSCLALMVQKDAYTLRLWNSLAVDGSLVAHLLSGIFQTVRKRELQEQLRKFVEQARIRYDLAGLDESVVQGLIAFGVLEVEETSSTCCYLKLSSPLLRMALLSRLPVRGMDVVHKSLPKTLEEDEDRIWVLNSLLKLFDGGFVENSVLDIPSGYSFQVAFTFRLKALLEKAYPEMGFEVLPEVREVPHLHARSLVVANEDDDFQSFAVEFVVSPTEETLEEHYERAATFAKEQAAIVYLINVTLDQKPNELIPTSSNVVFVSVQFRAGHNVAKVKRIYKSQAQVESSLKLKKHKTLH